MTRTSNVSPEAAVKYTTGVALALGRVLPAQEVALFALAVRDQGRDLVSQVTPEMPIPAEDEEASGLLRTLFEALTAPK